MPSQDSAQCQHRRTDHRGSNKQVRKTYCLDCGTYIDSVAQGVVKSISEDPDLTQVWVSTEERAMLDRVGEHDTIRRDEIVAAAQMMLVEARQLDGGDYTLLSIGNMFIDCADRVLADRMPPAPSAPAASAAPSAPAAMAFSRERNALVATLHRQLPHLVESCGSLRRSARMGNRRRWLQFLHTLGCLADQRRRKVEEARLQVLRQRQEDHYLQWRGIGPVHWKMGVPLCLPTGPVASCAPRKPR